MTWPVHPDISVFGGSRWGHYIIRIKTGEPVIDLHRIPLSCVPEVVCVAFLQMFAAQTFLTEEIALKVTG